MLMQTTLKVRVCKVCGKEFTPARPMMSVCSPRCAAKLGKLKKAQDKRETRARKEAIKTLPDLLREAQAAFNAWIRLRDQKAGYPCISSGRPLDWSGNGVDAGHYRSVGSAPHLRFNEDNVHAQSKKDNQWLAGNVADYRIHLIERIGLERVEALETNNSVHKWSKDEVRGIRDEYRARVREMKKETA